jgi:ribosomal protein S18 acetylase RimI-like enzyme
MTEALDDASVTLRTYTPQDHAAVITLWQACGLHPSPSDSPAAIARMLAHAPGLFVIAEQDGRVIGTVMGGFDGRRGWINRLAVTPGQRGRALGRCLMREVEQRLRALGCAKVNLLIEPENAGVAAFYARLGYATDELVFMEKWIGEEP